MRAKDWDELAVCSFCRTATYPADTQRHPDSVPLGRLARQRALWGLFGMCVLIALGLTVFVILRPQHFLIMCWVGFGIFCAGGVMIRLIWQIDPTEGWSPQMFIGLLGLPVMIGGLILGVILKPKPEQAAPPNGTPSGMHAEPELPPFVKPKTPPDATEFPDLAAYWSFEEGGVGMSVDAVSKTEGTLRSGAWGEGIRGRAIHLNGSSAVFEPGPAPGLNVGKGAPFTLALWVRPDRKEGTVFSFRSSPDGLAFLRLWLEGGKAKAWVRHNGGIFIPHGVGGKEPLRTGEWHHLALIRTDSGGLEFYQDGVLTESQPPGREATGAITTNARALGVDVMDEKNPDLKRFAGGLDEFCAFSRALTATEIAKLAGRGP